MESRKIKLKNGTVLKENKRYIDGVTNRVLTIRHIGEIGYTYRFEDEAKDRKAMTDLNKDIQLYESESEKAFKRTLKDIRDVKRAMKDDGYINRHISKTSHKDLAIQFLKWYFQECEGWCIDPSKNTCENLNFDVNDFTTDELFYLFIIKTKQHGK